MPGGIHPPAEVILKWPAPNYINPATRSNAITYVACIFGPVTLAMLLARLWVRIIHQRNPGWDDWLMIAGTIPTLGVTVIFPLAGNAFDRHIWDINLLIKPERMVVSRKYILTILCVFCISSGLIKISILLFYRRLSARVVSNTFRWTTWITIGFIASSSVAFTIVPLVGCNPVSAFWDQVNVIKLLEGYEYHCFDEGADIFSASVVSTVQDLITAVLPTFLYWDLRIPIRQKIALFGIFAIGYGVAVLGAMRAYYSWEIYFETYDVTWVAWDQLMVTLLELHVGCFCANAPTLKMFFKHFFHERLTSSVKKSPASSRQDQLGTQSSKGSAWMFKDQVSSFFSKGMSKHSKDGYISETHGDVTVDVHGDIQVQKDFHLDDTPVTLVIPEPEPSHRGLRESVDTTDIRYYEDIEMGQFTTGRNSQASSVYFHTADGEAVPSIPQTPRSPRSMRSSMSSHQYSRSPRASTQPDWPIPTTISEENPEEGKSVSLHPPPQRPHWQSWT